MKGRKNFFPKPFSQRKDVLSLSRQLTHYILQMVRRCLSPHFNISEIMISVMSYLIGSLSSFLTLPKVVVHLIMDDILESMKYGLAEGMRRSKGE